MAGTGFAHSGFINPQQEKPPMNKNPRLIPSTLALFALLTFPSVMQADDDITFTDVTTAVGIDWQRTPSERQAILDELLTRTSVQAPQDLLLFPIKPRGVPGLVVFDYDGDGDQDLYATNGPGTANSLYSNQFRETGELAFVDVGETAGVAAIDQDSAGAAAGDFDNDGDADLYVLGAPGLNRLFENQGDGTFLDITATSGAAGPPGAINASVCLGDVNGDGLLDIFATGASDFETNIPIFVPFPDLNEPNLLFLNQGGNFFTEVSEAAGLRFQTGLSPGFETAPTLTHACTFADLDRDGDLDLLTADDQAVVAPEAFGGLDRGAMHYFRNQGDGTFVDVNTEVGLGVGAWMGFAVADYNGDGYFDIFGTNFGSYMTAIFPIPIPPGFYNTRWFLGQEDGTFLDPGVGDLLGVPFGWGAVAVDYDNDADRDVIYHGGLDLGPLAAGDNPGVVLRNDGTAHFDYDATALAGSVDHTRRAVHGVAAGDFNEDGFVDIVSSANFNYPDPLPLIELPTLGGPFDATAFFWPIFVPTEDPDILIPNPGLPPLPNGDLVLEISDAASDNGSIAFELAGTVGITSGGVVNRDGVGATVRVRPLGGPSTMVPVTAGSSYASQSSGVLHFGLGDAPRAVIDVEWPGGVNNRYFLSLNKRVVLPEIPCSFDDPQINFAEYRQCVRDSLAEITAADIVPKGRILRLTAQAIRAWNMAH